VPAVEQLATPAITAPVAAALGQVPPVNLGRPPRWPGLVLAEQLAAPGSARPDRGDRRKQ
jgi:hypothetical protein